MAPKHKEQGQFKGQKTLPPPIRLRNNVFDWSRTYVMGILNITPDSFSDGGEFLNKESALFQAETLINEGADILDIGGESSRPFSEPVSVEEELNRVIPVIKTIRKRFNIPISVDTTKHQVAKAALDEGADIINDISALRFDSKMVEVAVNYDVPVILMHMKGSPKDMQINPVYEDVVKEVKNFLKQRLDFACINGIKRENIILDPGIGFGKSFVHNLEIINKINEIVSIGQPVLIGASRKAFIGAITDIKEPEKRDIPTLGVNSVCALKGAHIIRVHKVGITCQVLKVVDAIKKQGI